MPHRKACDACAFRHGNLQGLTDDDFDGLHLDRDLRGAEFFCLHRLVDGTYRRVCACWAAIGRDRAATRDREAA